jgi:hypothetical protein
LCSQANLAVAAAGRIVNDNVARGAQSDINAIGPKAEDEAILDLQQLAAEKSDSVESTAATGSSDSQVP